MISNLYSAFVALSLIWVISKLIVLLRKIKRLPNGPWGIPIVGYLPFLGNDLHLNFQRIAQKYGPVFSLRIGVRDVVILNDWSSIKQAMADETLLARPKDPLFPGIIDDIAILEMSGDQWKEHRRVAMQLLRKSGLGKSALDDLVQDEVDSYLSIISEASSSSKPFDIDRHLLSSVSNNIAAMLFGHRMSPTDPDKVFYDDTIEKGGKLFKFAGLFLFLPQLARLLIKLRLAKYDELEYYIRGSDAIIEKEVEKHKQGYYDGLIDNYIDGYLTEMNNSKSNSREIKFDLATLKRNAVTFYAAASETTHSTLLWLHLYLVKYPEIQEKVRKEIYSVIGQRRPNYSDRLLLPYTMSVIYETQRFASVLPINLIRRAAVDTKIGIHTIPKDTLVIFNFWTVSYDPDLWSNPENFDPTRFLTENGTKAVRPPYHIPFSGGKRVCPGENLAYVELFHYTVETLQKFQIKSPLGENISLEAETLVSRRPKNMPSLIFEKISD